MPELPEVETTRRGIAPHIEGQTVTAVVIRHQRLRWSIPEQLAERLMNQRIRATERRAKYLLIKTDAGTLIVHLGMSGSFRVLKESAASALRSPGKHDHVDIVLSSGALLRYTDPRRFGAMLWTEEEPCEHKLLNTLGPEPLSDDFTGQRLWQQSRGKKQPVKAFIMDNHVVVGVGNIYANEALFHAGIRPDRRCGHISVRRYKRLAECVKETLAEAIEQGGTTLKDFVGGDGKPGYFKQKLAVYGRNEQNCVRCSAPIVEMKVRNRSTFYCKKCQT